MLRRVAISCAMAALALTASARTRPHYGGTLRVEIAGDAWQRPDGLARRLVFDGLTRLDEDGNLRPALAIEWSSENADHRWQFRLRPGVHFHDGSALTSVTVAASLTASCATNCPWGAIHALGASVVFTSDSPMPNLPTQLAGDEFLIEQTASDAKAGGVGTGPFQVAGFSGSVLTLHANDSCWQGRPFVDVIEIRVHRAVRDQWLDLSMGRADLVEVPAENMRLADQQHLVVTKSASAELLALQVVDTGSLANANLRAAIAMAVDRGALGNVIFQKQGRATASLVPLEISGYAFLFSADRDLNKAHELRGGLNVPLLTISSEGDGTMQLAAQRIALNLHEAGFNVQSAGAGQNAELKLRTIPLAASDPAAALEAALRAAGKPQPVVTREPAALYRMERDFLAAETLIPLLDLPRAWASSGRVRDLRLLADGAPDLADASLEVEQ